jgi:hypothetical protein
MVDVLFSLVSTVDWVRKKRYCRYLESLPVATDRFPLPSRN